MPSRDWTAAERERIAAKPDTWIRSHKLTAEQVKDIRRRVDSLSIPWTLADLAREYGVNPRQIARIARRERWPARRYEPDEQPYWREREE